MEGNRQREMKSAARLALPVISPFPRRFPSRLPKVVACEARGTCDGDVQSWQYHMHRLMQTNGHASPPPALDKRNLLPVQSQKLFPPAFHA